MSERRPNDPVLEREELEITEGDPDQQPPFRDEFDVKPETPETND